jgi:hypothetical protein
MGSTKGKEGWKKNKNEDGTETLNNRWYQNERNKDNISSLSNGQEGQGQKMNKRRVSIQINKEDCVNYMNAGKWCVREIK